MNVQTFAIEGPKLITLDVYPDARGSFRETYNQSRYSELGIPPLVQDNLSISKRGVVRALHMQVAPHAQGKLVYILRGKVRDVAVDMRVGSPTYGQHVVVDLSAEVPTQFWIPAGFAHGFIALEDDTVFAYKCSDVYDKASERGVRYNDPTLAIDWGMPESEIIVNERDLAHPLFADIDPSTLKF